MAKPKVSVIVPVYNSASFLCACMDAITGQTLKEIEIICVNDGSTDTSLEILKEYAQKDERIVIINKQNGGLSRARNDAIKIAQGEYIGFFDSDDLIDIDYYEKLYKAATETNSDIACASIYRTDSKEYLLEIKKEKVYKRTSKKYVAANLPNCCYVWNKIYKTEKIKEYNCYFKNDIYYEDMPWTFRTFYLLGKIVTVPGVKYYYAINPTSIVKQKSEKHVRDYAESVAYIQNFAYEYNIKTSIESWRGKHSNRYYVSIFGLKILKIDEYKFAKCYYLFGVLPILQIKKFANIDLIPTPDKQRKV